MDKKTIGNILISCVISVALLLVGFSSRTKEPNEVYRVYLAGESVGLVESQEELESYIDNEQKAIKNKYKVKKVYAPADLDIVKEVTFDEKISTTKAIYEKIKDISPFTIDGYSVTIKGKTTKNSEGKEEKEPNVTVYVIDKQVFEDAAENTVKSFVTEEGYDNFKNDSQKQIEDTGTLIEKIYIDNTIAIKERRIPVDKTIYQKKEDLSKFLLFGTTAEQQKYTVQDGDTIEDVAFNNKISNEEFLIANPEFTDANSLLYPGQQVTLGILQPQFDVVEEDHIVSRQEVNYETTTEYDDSKYVGYSATKQAGVKGENRITQKTKKVNGETMQVVITNTEQTKAAINEIIVKGGKESYYNGGGSPVATRGEWGWPTIYPYYISSPFGYRWGVLHDAIDIAGCGEGSPIYAAQAGTVYQSSSKYDNGQYIVINHNNGYYTMYAHLCVGCRYVSVGDTVAKGQVIGGMGHTGAASGTHLHFGVFSGVPYRGGRPLNPMSFY